MAIRIATNVMATDIFTNERADAPPEKKVTRPRQVPKVVVNSNQVATGDNRMAPNEVEICAVFRLPHADYLRSRERYRRGLHALSGTVLGGGDEKRAPIGPIGSGGFKARG